MAILRDVQQFVYYKKLGVDMHLLSPGTKKHHHYIAEVTRDWNGKIRDHVKMGGNLGFDPGPGLLILDVDVKRGQDGFGQLEDFLRLTGASGIQDIAPQVRTPSGGIHIYLDHSHKPGRLWSSLREYPALDFLNFGSNVVCAGSLVEGGLYDMTRAGEPVRCPDEILAALGASQHTMAGDKEPSMLMSDLSNILRRLPNPDMPYDDWIRVGMALHFESGGSQEGVELWEEWSAKSRKYKPGVCHRKWRSFSDEGSAAGVVTWGTIDRYMREFSVPVFELSDLTKSEPPPAADGVAGEPGTATAAGGIQCIAPPPGLVGDLMQYILSCSPSPLPEAALAGALNFLSTMTRNRYTVDGSVRLNLYLMLVARTGSGKDTAFGQVARLLAHFGELHHLANGVTSGPSLRKNLAAAEGGYMSLHIDEASRWISSGNISARQGGSAHDTSARYELMELYGRAGSVMPARMGLNSKGKADASDTGIIQPFLNCLFATTPDRLLQAVTQMDFADGFMNRFLTLSTSQMPAIRKAQPDRPIPDELYARVIGMSPAAFDPVDDGAAGGDDQDDDQDDDGGQATASAAAQLCIRPAIDIPVTDDVAARHQQLLCDVRGRSDQYADLWQRVPEMIMRVSGVVAVGHQMVIDAEVYDWTSRFVTDCFTRLEQLIVAEHVESQHDEIRKRIAKFIGEGNQASDVRYNPYRENLGKEWVPKGLVTKRFARWSGRDRDAAINDLIEAGDIKAIKVRSGSNTVTLYAPFGTPDPTGITLLS